MRSRIAVMLLVLLLGGNVAYARSSSTKSQKQTEKQYKKYSHQQAKAQKKQLKQQNKAAKKWNREHTTTRHVT